MKTKINYIEEYNKGIPWIGCPKINAQLWISFGILPLVFLGAFTYYKYPVLFSILTTIMVLSVVAFKKKVKYLKDVLDKMNPKE